MDNNINLNNLRKDSEENNLTISCNYNLLNNDNYVSWSGNEIKLLKPYGLSNVRRIDFRNFKGDLLPFTQLELPKFRVEVVLTGTNVSEATITGVDGIFGETKYYNITNKDGNILLTFDKTWTYNADEDNQLIYNIKEAVAEVNSRLKEMYPFKTYYNEFDLSETYDNNYINKIYFDNDIIPINNNPGSTVLGWSKSLNKYVMAHINNSGAYEKAAFSNASASDARVINYASVSYDRKIVIYCRERNDSLYGTQFVRVNTSQNDNEFVYDWGVDLHRDEQYTTLNNVFNFYQKSPSCCLGTVNNMPSFCYSPIISETLFKALCVIDYNINGITKTESRWYLDFTQRAKRNIVNVLAYGDVIDKDGNAIDGLLSVLAIYIDINEPSNDVYTIGYFELNKSEIGGTAESPTVLINPVATKTIRSSEWTNNCKLMTCGKECYGVVKADITEHIGGEDVHTTYIWFKGAYVLSYQNSDINDFYLSEGYKYDDNTLFMFDDNAKEWCINDFLPSGQHYITWITEIINAKGYAVYNVVGKPILKGINPPLFIRGSANSIKGIISNPETYNTEFPDYSDDNPKYLNYSHINNALKCETEVELDMNVKGKDLNGGDIEMLIDKNYAITDSYNFFEFNDEGNIKTSQICLTKESALNMALKISTDPYYFRFTTPIEYYTSNKFSLIHPVVKPVFKTINDHVLNTIETLILLRYEYNNLRLTCHMFPNIDGVIFDINEDSLIGYKSMNISNTIDGLKIQIIDGYNVVGLETLKQIYGKLTLAIDWVQ